MKITSKKPKRIPCSKRYRLVKLQKERMRKRAKADKLNPCKPRNPMRHCHVPNKAPFKDAVLSEAVELKQQIADEKKLRRLRIAAENSEAKFSASCQDRSASTSDKPGASTGSIPQKFFVEVNKVVDMADIVVHVLDARDPLGTRCSSVEQACISKGKRVILLLNKCDLIPTQNLKDWITHLRRELPTLPFKASTQEQKNKLCQNRRVDMKQITDESVLDSKNCLGAQQLMKILGNYCRNKDIKTSIKVGLIGFPNVGKSSVINSLKRSKSCIAGAVAGLTRSAKEIQLDKHITLIDSPGVIFDRRVDSIGTALRNSCKVEDVADPVAAALEILKRAGKEQMSLQYRIQQDFELGDEFLALLAKARGFFDRGGIVSLEKAAKLLLNDWNSGKIKYFTATPEQETSADHPGEAAQIVSCFAKEFDLTDVSDSSMLASFSSVLPSEAVRMDLAGEDDSDKMQVGEVTVQSSQSIEVSSADKKQRNGTKSDRVDDESYLHLRQNKQKKLGFKKMKKTRRRADKISSALSENLEKALGAL